MAVALLLIGTAGPSSALASTLKVTAGGDMDYDALAGETNTVTVFLDPVLPRYHVKDTTAPITPTAPCTGGPAEAVCPSTDVRAINVNLGDMSDSATIEPSVFGLRGVTIFGGSGGDTLSGGANVENDLLGEDGEDVLNGGGRDDSLNGGNNKDTLTAGAGDDDLRGGLGDDAATGGTGDDRFSAQRVADGKDTFGGGAGIDGIDYRGRVEKLAVSLDGVANDGEAGELDNVKADIERVDSGHGDDTLVGNGAANDLQGENGADTLAGGGGSDDLSGDSGADTVNGGEGSDVLGGGDGSDNVNGGGGGDTLDGGGGNDALNGGDGDDVFLSGDDGGSDLLNGGRGTDLADYSDKLEAVTVDSDGTADDGLAGEHDNVKPDVEDLTGGIHADRLTGNAAANELTGGGGADALSGGGGSDGLVGGRGADTLTGGAGVDSLDGGAAADTLRSRDASPDEDRCGGGRDLAVVDRRDHVGAACDRVRRRR